MLKFFFISPESASMLEREAWAKCIGDHADFRETPFRGNHPVYAVMYELYRFFTHAPYPGKENGKKG